RVVAVWRANIDATLAFGLVDLGNRCPELDGNPGASRGRGEDRLQVGAMDHLVRKTIAVTERGSGNRCEAPAAPPVKYVDRDRSDRRAGDFLVEAKPGKGTAGIGRELDAGADLAQALCALHDGR